jgi:diguanylate cyclase (GGDEF)-like protein
MRRVALWICRKLRRGRRIDAAVRVRVFTGFLLATAVASAFGVRQVSEVYIAGRGGWVPFAIIAVLFAAAEVYPAHLHFMRNSHSYSMFEVPLTLGLFFVAPWQLLVAHVLGAGSALVLHRRQPAVKLAFNLSVMVIVDQIGIAVFRTIALDHGEFSPRSVIGASCGALIASCLSALAVISVIALSEGRRAEGLTSSIAFASTGSLLAHSLGLIAVGMISAYPWAVWLLVVPTTGLYLASQTFAKDLRRTEGLEFLHDSTKLLLKSPELESALLHLVQHARATFRAGFAELAYLPGENGDIVYVNANDNGGLRAGGSSAGALVDTMIARVAAATGSQLLVRMHCDADEAAFLDRYQLSDAIISPLRGEHRMCGFIVIGNRLGDVAHFDRADSVLLETFAGNITVALENSRLEQTLDDLRVLQQGLRFDATHDPLTGLANRKLFIGEVSSALAASQQTGGRSALLFIDLDNFKSINDILGHGIGDVVLVTLGLRFQEAIQGALVARLGGDEFAVLLPAAPADREVVDLAERLLVAAASPVSGVQQSVPLGASIGIAFSHPGQSASDLLRTADVAMYAAKQRGKNQVAVFEANASENRHSRRAVVADEPSLLGVHLGSL